MKQFFTTCCLLVALLFYCGDVACYGADSDHACHMLTGVQSADEACGASVDLAPERLALPALLPATAIIAATAKFIALQHPVPSDTRRHPEPHLHELELLRGPPALS
jgi:hypothetical protein